MLVTFRLDSGFRRNDESKAATGLVGKATNQTSEAQNQRQAAKQQDGQNEKPSCCAQLRHVEETRHRFL